MPRNLTAAVGPRSGRDPQNFEFAAGEATILKVTVFDEDGNPLPLEGTISVEWKLGRTARSPAPILSKSLASGITILTEDAAEGGANAGRLDIALEPEDTVDLVGEYFHTCFLVSADAITSQVFYGRPFARAGFSPPPDISISGVFSDDFSEDFL